MIWVHGDSILCLPGPISTSYSNLHFRLSVNADFWVIVLSYLLKDSNINTRKN